MSDDPQATDELVLADPGSYNVDEVLDVFARSTVEAVFAAQETEQEGKARKGILDFRLPEPEQPPELAEGEYSRDRILDPWEGPAIVGFVEELGRGAKYPEIVGALDGDDSATFTTDEVRGKIAEFLARPFAPAGTTEEA